tara:strand:+ start:100 stop:585 length:486 start_codon:yes stop_codon:yes gene_type:complete
MANRIVDSLITYRIVKLLVTPFNRQEAYREGIIDDKGKTLIKFRELKTEKQRQSYTFLHRFIFNLKRILGKVGLGGRLGSFATALALLIKEDKSYSQHKNTIESAVISYLKETNQFNDMLKEEGDTPDFRNDDEVVSTCFGIDVYEKDGELVTEKEYAKTL